MTTQDPDWKALCVAYVKADEECVQLALAPIDEYRVADKLRDAAIAAIYAAVKAHGDA